MCFVPLTMHIVVPLTMHPLTMRFIPHVYTAYTGMPAAAHPADRPDIPAPQRLLQPAPRVQPVGRLAASAAAGGDAPQPHGVHAAAQLLWAPRLGGPLFQQLAPDAHRTVMHVDIHQRSDTTQALASNSLLDRICLSCNRLTTFPMGTYLSNISHMECV